MLINQLAIFLDWIKRPKLMVDYGPHFSHMFPLDGKTHFFICENSIFRKRLEIATYFSFIFLKGKQNKKKKP